MSDDQVMQFYQKEHKAGTSNGQIVTKLMQRGVQIDQIRRVRNQYQSQNQTKVDGGSAVTSNGTLRNNSGSKPQELTSGNMQLDRSSQETAEQQYVQVQRNINEHAEEVLSPGGKKSIWSRHLQQQTVELRAKHEHCNTDKLHHRCRRPSGY